MSINFETICRLCMAESKSMISVFEKSNSLTEKIMTLIPVVKISEGDNLPAQVCEGCVNQVNNLHSFKLQCENSHFALSELLKSQQEDQQVLDIPPDVPPIETIILESKCKQEVEDEKELFSVKQEETEVEQSVVTQEKAVPCHICTKLIVRKRFKEHMRRHLGGRPFNCEECGKTFPDRDSLKKHALVHSGLKAHMCDICGKSFKFLNQLKMHHLIHTGQKPYVCDICGKRFSQLGSLRTHEMVHTGEKPFNCDICGKGYSQKNGLRIHLTVHSGQRQHWCKVCGKGFLLKGNLQNHLVVHSGEKKFSCNICGASYTQRHSLKKHARKHD